MGVGGENEQVLVSDHRMEGSAVAVEGDHLLLAEANDWSDLRHPFDAAGSSPQEIFDDDLDDDDDDDDFDDDDDDFDDDEDDDFDDEEDYA